jgi:hypothetical protein
MGKAYRFLALRYQNAKEPEESKEQYQLFDTPPYSYRVFVTNMKGALDLLVWFYRQRGAENLIKEANNDGGLAAHPSQPWATNCVHFQLVMLAYNLNCWLLLHSGRRGEGGGDETYHVGHDALALSVSGGQVLDARGRVGISYSDQYPERGLFQRLMDRLRAIVPRPGGFSPVLATELRS